MKYLGFEKAVSLMEAIRKETRDIGVFTDRGWGDDPDCETSYTIIKDGHGQNPLAHITKETFEQLKKDKLIGPNRYRGYKARAWHGFKENA